MNYFASCQIISCEDWIKMSFHRWTDMLSRLLWAYEGPVPEDGRGRQGISSSYFAWLLLEGEAHFSFNRRESAALRPGCWGFPPPNAADRIHSFSPDARLLSLQFRLEWPGGRAPFQIKKFLSFEASSHPELGREAKRLAKLAKGFIDFPVNSETREFGFERQALVQASFWRWLALWKKALDSEGIPEMEPTAMDERVERMLEALKAVRQHGPVPYAKLEEASSLGQIQIDRLFQAQLGASPKRILERHLLELCKERLQCSRLSAKEISEEFGFPHPANFCAWFAKKAGRPPQRFRRSA